jgi:hypothetical protein
MTYPASPTDAPASRVRPDAAQFWAGAVATAVVAALIALVGILICRWTLHIPILAPAGEGAWGNAHTGEYVLLAALIAIVAGGLLYLLTLGTPQPRLFFNWIMGLATVAAVVYPFSTSAPLAQKGATALVDLVLGLAITSLLTAVAARAVRRPVIRRRVQATTADPRYGRDAYGPGQGYRPGPGYDGQQAYPGEQAYPGGQAYPSQAGPVEPGEVYPAEPGYPEDDGYRGAPGQVPGQRPYQPTRPIDTPQRRRR